MDKTSVKYDGDKVSFAPMAGLVMAIWEVGKVLFHGMCLYGCDNWRGLSNIKARYWSAATRHLLKAQRSNVDETTGLSHTAHAIASLLFLLQQELEETYYGIDYPYKLTKEQADLTRAAKEQANK